jgi:hypothetical protein
MSYVSRDNLIFGCRELGVEPFQRAVRSSGRSGCWCGFWGHFVVFPTKDQCEYSSEGFVMSFKFLFILLWAYANFPLLATCSVASQIYQGR